MSWRTKVVWSEGMLLQPQHLQQSERHADHARHVLLRSTTPYAWGFTRRKLRDLLQRIEHHEHPTEDHLQAA